MFSDDLTGISTISQPTTLVMLQNNLKETNHRAHQCQYERTDLKPSPIIMTDLENTNSQRDWWIDAHWKGGYILVN